MKRSSPQIPAVLHILVCCVLCCGIAIAQQAGGEISGVVKSGGQPLPGVAVTAANTLTGHKAKTSTDVDGSYKLHVGANGRYVVRAQFTAFAPATQEVMINAASPTAKMDFELVLASRAKRPGEEAPEQAAAAPLSRRGFQSLGVNQSENGGEPGGAELATPARSTSLMMPRGSSSSRGWHCWCAPKRARRRRPASNSLQSPASAISLFAIQIRHRSGPSLHANP